MTSTLPKLAFVDMEFHKKTRSGDFLREILTKHFEVDDYWYDPTKEINYIEFTSISSYRYIFFFQVLFPYREMLLLRESNINIVWAPMYDGLPMGSYYWRMIASLKINLISFCKAITERCIKFGIRHISLQYFMAPKPMPYITDNEKVSIFFWYRGSLRMKDWFPMVSDLPIKEILYLQAPDPKYEKDDISEYMNLGFKVTLIEADFLNKEDYLKLVESSEIFVCPRTQEGIGMSLVEALSMGKFLLAYDDNSMNNYIEHRSNGFLFTDKSKGKLTLTDIVESGNKRLEVAKKGFSKWELEKNTILSLFDKRDNKQLKYSIIQTGFFLTEYTKSTIKKLIKFKLKV